MRWRWRWRRRKCDGDGRAQKIASKRGTRAGPPVRLYSRAWSMSAWSVFLGIPVGLSDMDSDGRPANLLGMQHQIHYSSVLITCARESDTIFIFY